MVMVNTKKEGGATLPDGNYEVKVEKVTQKVNEENGNVRIGVHMVVLEGGDKGTKVSDWLPFSENALWRTLPIIRGMGIDVPEDTENWDFEEESLVGLNFVATFKEDTWEGRTSNVIVATKASDKKFAATAITDDIPF